MRWSEVGGRVRDEIGHTKGWTSGQWSPECARASLRNAGLRWGVLFARSRTEGDSGVAKITGSAEAASYFVLRSGFRFFFFFFWRKDYVAEFAQLR